MNTVTDDRPGAEELPGLSALLGAGFDVEFRAPDAEGRIECVLTRPAGDVITACGATPAAALAEASPLLPPCGLCQLRAERGIEPPEGGCTCRPAPVAADRLDALEARLDALEVRAEELEGR